MNHDRKCWDRISVKRVSLGGLSAALVLMSLGGCGNVGSASEYNFECSDAETSLLSIVNLSAGARDEQILGERLNSIQVDVERALDCEARLTVIAWSSSSASSRTIFDGELATKGASEIGRDRKIADAANDVMSEMRDEFQAALEAIDGSSSDMTSAFSIASDFVQGLQEGVEAEVTIYADGISTTGLAQNNSPTMSIEDMVGQFSTLSTWNLGETPVSVLGIGRVGGVEQPPEDYVNKLRTYMTQMCEMASTNCRVATTVSQSL